MTTSAHYTLLWLVCGCFLCVAGVAGQLQRQDLLQDLLVTAQAHQRLQQEYSVLGSGGALSSRERSDFEDYLNGLAGRVAAKCGTLLTLFPDTGLEGLPCAAPMPSMAPVVDVAAERTTRETVAELDAVLLEGVADFDEMLLREQQEIASRTPRARAAAGGGDQGSAGDAGQTGDEGEAREGTEQSADSGQSAEAGGKAGPMPAGRASRGSAGGERPTDTARRGSDDDVVARQLREAAEREQDPALKEKLWEEYRRYKASTGR